MKLIGMMDSPYVRRVAISLDCYGVAFDSLPLSVFRDMAQFSAINPLVKAPTLVLDDATLLMDSTLITQYFEAQAPTDRKQLPTAGAALAADSALLATILVACEKAVQRVYEQQLRPAEKQHQPWIDRVSGQLLAACDRWQHLLASRSAESEQPDQVTITSAVVWSFIQLMLPEVIKVAEFSHLAALTEKMEALPAFIRYPQR